MEKLFNSSCIYISSIGGIIAKLIGGYDVLFLTLVIFMGFDYITGVLKAFYLKKIDSAVGFWGIVKKCIILIIVSASVVLSKVINSAIPLRETVILFFISNEGISLLENSATFIPLPESLKNALQQIRNKEKSSKQKD